MNLKYALCAVAAAASLAAAAPSGAALKSLHRAKDESSVTYLKRSVAFHRYVCRHGARQNQRWHCAALVWTRRELRERIPARPARPTIAHQSLWQCIHSREGSWTDGGAPYWGGLQMGSWFHSTYAAHLSGTADTWSATTQMLVAENAYRREGYSRAWLFGQWPNTAPPCAHLA